MASGGGIVLLGLVCSLVFPHCILLFGKVQTIEVGAFGSVPWVGCRLCHKLGLAVLAAKVVGGCAASVLAQSVCIGHG